MVLLSDVAADYLNVLRVERGCSPRTVSCYSSWTTHFFGYLKSQGVETPAVEDFTLATLKRYLYHLSGRGLRPRTIRSAFFPLQGLGKFMVSMGLLEKSPTEEMHLPKLDAPVQHTCSDEEVLALLAAVERQRNPVKVARERAILCVLCYGALRRMECLDLKVGDIDLARGCIIVRQGKGQKTRTVFPYKDCMLALRQWLALRPKDASHDYLFAFDRSRRVSRTGLANMLENIKFNAGLESHDNIHPHSLRRAAATRLLRQGGDLRAIQSFLGHSHLTTTAIYLSCDEVRLRQLSEIGGLMPAPVSVPKPAEPPRENREKPEGRQRIPTRPEDRFRQKRR